jgi:hypothetical protein
MKLIGGTIQAVTQVKVLSLVIFNVVEADALRSSGKQQEQSRKGEGLLSLPGSKSTACIEMEIM